MIDAELAVDPWAAAFSATARRARDLRAILGDVGAELLEVVRHQFDTRGAYGNWPELAPATIAERARLGLDDHPLLRSGGLRRSLEVAVEGDEVTIGSRLPQASRLFAVRNPLVLRDDEWDRACQRITHDVFEVWR